jgi:hypothetical protein
MVTGHVTAAKTPTRKNGRPTQPKRLRRRNVSRNGCRSPLRMY